jgi:23S rRNA (cytosine1962-C5)-methyltransferase
VKSRKDLAVGIRAYRKLAKLAAGLVRPGGFLLIASCSHNVAPDAFAEQICGGLSRARRSGRILRAAGAAADHPVHPFLPESAYLKALLLQLD